MAHPDNYSQHPHPPVDAQTPPTLAHDRGIVHRWHERRTERKIVGLLRPRRRRALAQALRGTAKDATERGSCLHSSVLLRDRAAAVRTELLEIAALLEQARDPDPACVNEIHQLLTKGDSPLYHPGAHVSELYATLYYIRAGLVRDRASRPAPRPRIPNHKGIERGRPDASPGETPKR